MPPTVALGLCILLVIFLLRLERKQSRSVSLSLWLPTIWTFYCASRPVSGWFVSGSLSEGPNAIEEGSAPDRFFLSALIVCGFVALARAKLKWSEVLKENRWLVLLYAYMGVSILWSDYPWISFKRWIKVFGSLLMALVVLAEASPLSALEAILRRSAYVLIPFSLLLTKYFPDLGVQYDRWLGKKMWVGVTTQKNCLGRLCLISIFFLLWSLYRKWKSGALRPLQPPILADVVVLLLSMWLLMRPSLFAISATGIVSLGLGISMFILMAWIKRRWRHPRFNFIRAIAVVGMGLGIAIPLVGGSDLEGLVSLLGRDITFTGRTDIWAVLVPIAWRHPLFGLGYGGFWVNPPVPWAWLNESHNGYLEVFLELGIVGLFLLLGFLFSFCSNAQRALARHFDWAAFGICLLLIALFHNITEASLVRASSHLWTILLFLGVLMARLSRTTPALKESPAPLPRSRVNPALTEKNLKAPALHSSG